jgi:hypothetical protein
MMKPYFTLFRNYYPRSNNFFYAAHWWHPVIYEAMMLGGNGKGQERMIRETDQTFYREVTTLSSSSWPPRPWGGPPASISCT